MISKNQIKFIKSLENKKVRYREGLFIAEGPKVVGDLLAEGFKPHTLVAVEGWSYNYKGIAINADFVVTEEELRKVSFLQHPQQVIGVFPIPTNSIEHIDTSNNLVLALDDVQDPGNLGTIIRESSTSYYGKHCQSRASLCRFTSVHCKSCRQGSRIWYFSRREKHLFKRIIGKWNHCHGQRGQWHFK